MNSRNRTFGVGQRVRYAENMLRAGCEPSWRSTVVACDCGLCSTGRFVALNEPSMDSDGQRHISVTAIRKAGATVYIV